MEILTNKVKIKYEHLNTKFDIYELKVKLNSDNKIFLMVNKLVNSLKNNDDVYSVYRPDSKFKIYFLVKKNSIPLKLKNLFDEKILKYFIDNELISEPELKDNMNSNEKLNLLLNDIKNYDDDNERCESFGGKLYEILRAKKDYLISLRYSFKDECLNADVVTFKKNVNPGDNIVFYINDRYLIKKTNSVHKEGYVIESEKHSKNNLNYFSAKDLKSLEECKIYKINRIYKKFNKIHKDICEIEFQKEKLDEKNFESITKEFKSDKKRALQITKDIGINIIDNVCNEKKLAKIKKFFDKNNITYEFSNDINKDKLNLNIIYSKKHYGDEGKIDKYLKSSEFVVQNLILENDDNKSNVGTVDVDNNKMSVIVSELVHKYELIKRKIFHHNFENKIIKKFAFGRTEKLKGKNYLICELLIEKGELLFKSIQEESKDKYKLKEGFYLRDKETGKKYQIEVLPKYPLTEINDLVNAFRETLNNVEVESDLVPLLNEFKNNYTKNNKYGNIIDKILEYLKMYDRIKMCELYKKIKKELYPTDSESRKEYSNCLKELNKFLWNKKYKNIYFKPLWRGKNQPIKQAFEKFKYSYDDVNGLQYYSGSCNSLNQSICHGFPYRQIKCEFNQEEINDYLKLLDVDDIRHNQNTVIPYPFKYITEFIKNTCK